MPLGELPGRLSDFIGATKRSTKHALGLDPSGLEPDDEAFGMNPRRAYWAAALQDLSSMTMGQPMQGLGMQVNQAQAQHVQQRRSDAINNEYKSAIAQAQLMNAMKPAKGEGTPSIIREARELYPDDPDRQREYVEAYRAKAPNSVSIDFADSGPKEYLQGLLKDVPAVHQAATQAADEIARYDAMDALIPQLGNTGNAKEWAMNLRSGLTSLGMGHIGGFLDALSEAAGGDIFTGDQGAAELFRALSNQDVLDRAKELYPVSNTDIQFLKEMSVTMKTMSDPEAMRSMLGNRRRQSQRAIDQYNWHRQALQQIPGLPPLPEIIPYDTNAIGRRADQLEAEERALQQGGGGGR